MAEPQFPTDAKAGDHFVADNRLWVYSMYTTEDNKTGYRWELWGNLQYVPVPGEPGAGGLEGPTGATGATGTRGKTGATGRDGVQGATGDKGDRGASITLRGNKATFDDLQLVSVKDDGDAYSVTDAGEGYEPYSVFVWNERLTSWEFVGPLQGPPGEKGQTGDTGKEGPAGPAGANGVAGLNGAHGGAFCHMVDYVPSGGPAGKIYMLRKDHSVYITTGFE